MHCLVVFLSTSFVSFVLLFFPSAPYTIPVGPLIAPVCVSVFRCECEQCMCVSARVQRWAEQKSGYNTSDSVHFCFYFFFALTSMVSFARLSLSLSLYVRVNVCERCRMWVFHFLLLLPLLLSVCVCRSLSRLVLHCDYFGINVDFIYTYVDGAASQPASQPNSIDNNLSDQVVEFVKSFFRVEPIRSVRFLFRLIWKFRIDESDEYDFLLFALWATFSSLECRVLVFGPIRRRWWTQHSVRTICEFEKIIWFKKKS